MSRILLEAVPAKPTWERPFEIVERKGVGHPDTICDAIMEEAARSLARAYIEAFGAPQHFNLDKGLLAAGKTTPRFSGGTIDAPMRLVFGDRAVYSVGDRAIPVAEILVETARKWFRDHLRFVDPDRQLVFQNEVRPGSPQLSGLFAAANPPANDTSAAVGVAPLSVTERLVLEAERFVNSAALKERFPETGEDVKVMAVRRGDALSLTLAVAFVDRFVDSAKTYFARKQELHDAIVEQLTPRLEGLSSLSVAINTLDAPGGGGADSVYLTVTGTSSEGADSGQVGRGNRLSGLFSARRAASNEAVAGKNPQSHVGKVYNVLAQRMAERIVAIDGVLETAVHLVSRIGRPLNDPQLAAVELVLESGVAVKDVSREVEGCVETILGEVALFAAEWIAGRAGSPLTSA